MILGLLSSLGNYAEGKYDASERADEKRRGAADNKQAAQMVRLSPFISLVVFISI